MTARMTVREVLRRIAVWSIVPVFAAASLWTGSYGQWTTLTGFWAYVLVGAIILTERPRNGVGRYLLFISWYSILLMWGLVPELLIQLPPWAELLSWVAATPFLLLVPAVALVFPTGRLQTGLARFVAWLLGALILALGTLGALDPDALASGTGRANPIAVPEIAPFAAVWTNGVQYPVIISTFVLMLADLTLRWRRSDGVERLQYRWLVFGVGSMLTIVVGAVALGFVFPSLTDDPLWIGIATASLNLPAIAIGIAVTRHGLYGIGRIVSRTVSYTAVTAFALATYAAVVIALGAILPQQEAIPVAIATLAAAAVFLPLLRWLRRVVDRRFDRARFDAEAIVEAFGDRLRSGTGVTRVDEDLRGAVDRALQPASIGVWTRKTPS